MSKDFRGFGSIRNESQRTEPVLDRPWLHDGPITNDSELGQTFDLTSNGFQREFSNFQPRTRLPETDDTPALYAEFQELDQNEASTDLQNEIEFLETELRNTSSLNSVFAALNSNLDHIQNSLEVLNSNLLSTNNILSNWTSFIRKSIFNTTLLATPSWKGGQAKNHMESLEVTEQAAPRQDDVSFYQTRSISRDVSPPETQLTPLISQRRKKRRSLKEVYRNLHL